MEARLHMAFDTEDLNEVEEAATEIVDPEQGPPEEEEEEADNDDGDGHRRQRRRRQQHGSLAEDKLADAAAAATTAARGDGGQGAARPPRPPPARPPKPAAKRSKLGGMGASMAAAQSPPPPSSSSPPPPPSSSSSSSPPPPPTARGLVWPSGALPEQVWHFLREMVLHAPKIEALTVGRCLRAAEAQLLPGHPCGVLQPFKQQLLGAIDEALSERGVPPHDAVAAGGASVA